MILFKFQLNNSGGHIAHIGGAFGVIIIVLVIIRDKTLLSLFLIYLKQ